MDKDIRRHVRENGAVKTEITLESRARIQKRFLRHRVMASIGSRLGLLRLGSCDLTYTRREEDLNAEGSVSDSVLSALGDAACGFAAMTLVNENATTITIEYILRLSRTPRASHYVAGADVVEHCPGTFICRGRILEFDDTDDGRVVATMQASIVTIGAN